MIPYIIILSLLIGVVAGIILGANVYFTERKKWDKEMEDHRKAQ